LIFVPKCFLGTQQVFNQAPVARQPRTQTQTQTVRTTDKAIDPDRFIFGISAIGGGTVGTGLMGGGGGLRFEFGKGNFNSQINFVGGIPDLFNLLATFNYFWHGRLGGFYLGGGLGYCLGYYRYWYEWNDGGDYWQYYSDWGLGHFFQFGLNTGYKFVTRSGLFFNIGAYIGGAVGYDFLFIFKPDISFGWTMR